MKDVKVAEIVWMRSRMIETKVGKCEGRYQKLTTGIPIELFDSNKDP